MGSPIIKNFLLAATLFLWVSCGNPAVYHQYQLIPSKGWEGEQEYYFTFMIEEAAIPYNVILEIRNNNLYPYQNLWVLYQEELPTGDIRQDTVQCMLADDFGKWSGKGISLFESSFPIRSGYMFPMKGQYTFSFRQGMRNDTLTGIQEIGLRVERAK
ncbi:MAG: gliding motility lipoprotein GldH [Bacteroidales bacterium]